MISVIIPLYNKELIIAKSLKSVLSQDYDDFEVVVVNDGSTDRSTEIVRSIADSRIILIEQKNGGPSKARNIGVTHSKGEWIVFLDADDELLPGALTRFYFAIKQHSKADFIACPFYNDNGTQRILMYPYKKGFIKKPFKYSFLGSFLPRTGAFICKKELLNSYPFNESIRRFEDLEMLYRLYNHANIYTISEPSVSVNTEFVAASHARRDITEDFLGHIDFKRKSFWEKMCLYQFYLGERPFYKEQCNKMYKTLRWRYDLLILNKILNFRWH